MCKTRDCLWNVKPEERKCEYCVVEHCQSRNKLPEQKSIAYTSDEFIRAYFSGNLIVANKND